MTTIVYRNSQRHLLTNWKYSSDVFKGGKKREKKFDCILFKVFTIVFCI